MRTWLSLLVNSEEFEKKIKHCVDRSSPGSFLYLIAIQGTICGTQSQRKSLLHSFSRGQPHSLKGQALFQAGTRHGARDTF